MQTAREAIDCLLRKRPADFVPLEDAPWGDTQLKWVKEGMPTGPDGKPVDPVSHFNFDMAGCGGWFRWAAKLSPDEVLEENADWAITRNGNGAVFKNWKTRSGTPEHIAFHMADRTIWEREYRPLLEPATARQRLGDLGVIRARRQALWADRRWVFSGCAFVWEYLRASLGDENMMVALLEDPDWIHDFNRVYTDLIKECYRLEFAEAGLPDGVWIYEDLGYRDRLFCNPSILADLFFPYYREMIEFFHGYNLPVVLHSCGFQKPMIPLAVEAGFDGLNPMEVKAGNDILQYAEEWGDRLCFVGGFDARILESGDRDNIRKGVTNFINGMRERGARFIYGSDHSLSTRIHYRDFLYSLEIYRGLRANG